MESLQSILLAVQPGDWMVSVDLQDAYLHVPVNRGLHKYLRFAIGKSHYQFICLPFGLTSSPRVFSKVLLTSVATLREKGLRIFHYLDDILILSRSPGSLATHREVALSTLQQFGWLISWQKSHLVPTQQLVFLGASLDTARSTVSLPEEKIPIVRGRVTDILRRQVAPARDCLRVLGTMTATFPMVKWARWNSRPFQMGILDQWFPEDLSQKVQIFPAMRQCLAWWLSAQNLRVCHSLIPVVWIIISSDASETGWGACCQGMCAQGQWPIPAKGTISNVLELRAAFQALLAFQELIQGKAVLLKVDNVTAAAYIKKQGGTRSHSLLAEATPLLNWAQLNLSALSAQYIPGPQNQEADFLSRTNLDNNEWSLHPQVFKSLAQWAFRPQVDLFASPRNNKTKVFISRTPCPLAWAADALTSPWPFRRAYAFSSCSSDRQVPPEDVQGESRGPGDNTILATPTLVSPPSAAELRGTPTTAHQTRPVDAGANISSSPRQVTSSGMEIERRRLANLGCTPSVIATLTSARKRSTNATYNRVWANFCSFAQIQSFSPEEPGIADVLQYLQKGLELGLSLSTLKGQISALTAFTGIRWATDPLVARFFRAVLKLRPPTPLRFPKWDLPLVLQFLASPTFALESDPSLWDLTLKTVFLVAITSASRVSELAALGSEEPFITFFEDRVVLVPVEGFLPKVSSRFHLNRELVLPAFRDGGSSDISQLDVRATLKAYVEATAKLRKSGRLFILPTGANKGNMASSRVLSTWIVKTISRAYKAKDIPVPSGLRAHSTRGMAASWAAVGKLSPVEICKAASWSSSHTFMSHYQIEPAALTTVNFGRTVLTSALSM